MICFHCKTFRELVGVNLFCTIVNSNQIIQNAKAQGAEMIITACPLCKYNLEKNGADIPVVYFTELLAEALGVKEDTNGK